MNQDTNFDDLTEHFQKRIYGSRKGKIRLAILQRDLAVCVPALAKSSLKILDLGAGLGQMGVALAKQGHDVCINDISSKMLEVAKSSAKAQGVEQDIQWKNKPFQDLADQSYDLILCHAVLEWLDEPVSLMQSLQALTKKGGQVSLMFYNFDALVFHNLVRGNFKKIKNKDFSGMKGGLTPPNPAKADWVEAKLAEYGFDVVYKSGVRVFSDYVGIKRGGNENDDDVLTMELEYSTQLPYLNMGRYIHFVCKKNESNITYC